MGYLPRHASHADLTTRDDLESVLPCAQSKITQEVAIERDEREYDHGHGAEFQEIRFRLTLAHEMQMIRSRLGWSVRQMWQEVRERDWRSFPYSELYYRDLDRQPRAMARYLLRYPRLYDIVIKINDDQKKGE